MLLNPLKQIWTGLRYDIKDAWQMPQGGIDDSESPRDAAFRELYEEIGVKASDVTVLAETKEWLSYDLPEEIQKVFFNGRYKGQTQKWFLMQLISSDTQIILDLHTPEFEAYRWVAQSELTNLIVPFKKSMYEAVLLEFADLLK
jgi:putative (di)nucleoside polyphosphate hydrolase